MTTPDKSVELWRSEWRTIWLVVHPLAPPTPCTDEDLARHELDGLEASSGEKGELVGPFVLTEPSFVGGGT